VRAVSLLSAPPVALAAVAVTVAFLVPPAVPSFALAERWLRPVPGAVARSFAYSRAAPFVAGAHRGVDLAAALGTTVRAVCGGRVMHAGAVAAEGLVVSVRCGKRRVSYLQLATVAVRTGARVLPGARLGTVGARHGGLHVGVRLERDRFGYVDPLPLLSGRPRVIPPAVWPRATRTPRRAPRSAPRLAPQPASRLAPQPAPGLAPSRPYPPPAARRRVPAPHPRTRPAPRDPGVAPWPVWAGLGLLLSGAAGSGTIAVGRRRRCAQRRVRTAESPA
jgi:murein DD-endopeptidase MepM/ murein hydrolase activator NlpD